MKKDVRTETAGRPPPRGRRAVPAGPPERAETVLTGDFVNLLLPVDELPLTVRASNGLRNAGITYLFELVQHTEGDLRGYHGIGRASIEVISEAIGELGFHLGWRLPVDISAYPDPRDAWDAVRKLAMGGPGGVGSRASDGAGRWGPTPPAAAKNLLRRIDELRLSTRPRNCMAAHGIVFVFQLVTLSESRLLRLRGLGPKSFRELRATVAALGLHFDWRPPFALDAFEDLDRAREALARHLSECETAEAPVLDPAALRNPIAVLSQPWTWHIELSNRAKSLLLASRIRTMSDLLGLPPADSAAAGDPRQDLYEEVRQAMLEFESRYGSLRNSALVMSIERAGIADVPASALGPLVREAVEKVEWTHGPQTLGSIARVLPFEGLDVPPWAECLFRGLQDVAEEGLDGIPHDIADLLRIASSEGDRRGWQAVRYRYLDGCTLAEVGRRLDLTAERARQILRETLRRANLRCGIYAQAILPPIAAAFESAGGILHANDLAPHLGGARPEVLPLVWEFAGASGTPTWQAPFLVRSGLDVETIAREIALGAAGFGRAELSVKTLKELGSRVLGAAPPPETVLRLFEAGLGVASPDVRGADAGGSAGLQLRLVDCLRERGAPVPLLDLVCAAEPRLRRRALLAMKARERNAILQRAMALLDRAPRAYRVGQDTFCHRDALPVPLEALDRAVEWCARLLAGHTRAVSIGVLLRELAAAGELPPGLSDFLLKDALKRHPDVVPMRKLYVRHAKLQEARGNLVRDRVLAVLHEAGGAMGYQEIGEALRDGGKECSVASLRPFLAGSPSVLKLGSDRYLHPDRVGLSSEERGRLVDAAVALLPAGGGAVAVDTLTAHLGSAARFGDLAAPFSTDAVLGALLCCDPRVVAPSPGHVALRSEDGDDAPIDDLVVDRLGELGAASRAELERALSSGHGRVLGRRALQKALTRLVAQGKVLPLVASLYAIRGADRTTVLQGLGAHRHPVVAAARRADPSRMDPGAVEHLADFLSREGRETEARRFLRALARGAGGRGGG